MINNEIPPAKNAFTKNGVVHGNNDIAGLYVNVKIWVANKPIKPITTLQKTIGIKKTGFNITGIQKINGSLILNKLGIKANFSIFLYLSLLAVNIDKHNPSVLPLPPKDANSETKVIVK